MNRIQISDKKSIFEAYNDIKRYLQKGNETPMAYILHIHPLVKGLAESQGGMTSMSWADEIGHELVYKGDKIHLSGFKTLVHGLISEYQEFVDENIFFGEGMPPSPDLPFDINNIVDDMGNDTLGYSYLDDNRNPFRQWKDKYIEWILTSPHLRDQFIHIAKGKLYWKPAETALLIRHIDRAREILSSAAFVSQGGNDRMTEIGDTPLRNIGGMLHRGVGITHHTYCYIGQTHKGDWRTVRNSVVVHPPSHGIAQLCIYADAVLRPAQEYLAGIIYGPEAAHRIHNYIWAGVDKNMTSEQLSEQLGMCTEKYMGVRLTASKIRQAFTAFAHQHGDPQHFELNKQFYLDVIQNHCPTAYSYYAVNAAAIRNTDERHIIGCIKATANWQNLTGISGEHPIFASATHVEPAPPNDDPQQVTPAHTNLPPWLTRHDGLETLAGSLFKLSGLCILHPQFIPHFIHPTTRTGHNTPTDLVAYACLS